MKIILLLIVLTIGFFCTSIVYSKKDDMLRFMMFTLFTIICIVALAITIVWQIIAACV